MTLRLQPAALLTLPLALALALTASACSDDTPGTSSSDESGSESGESTGEETSTTDMTGDGDGDPATGDGDGDPTGDGDGDPTGDGDGDPTGDGDGDPTGDGDGDPGDGDGDPGDGDGDPGDGDGDPGNACQDDVFIDILAVDADYNGWDPGMSMLGEGMILIWDGITVDAAISFDLDIPCDDDWHVWGRGVDNGANDSFFVLVDGGPMPIPIYELDCTGQPQQGGVYRWNELNWRDQNAQSCDYLQDPWVQTWDAGAHNVTFGYRESQAMSRLWVTNTDQMPPMP